MVSNIGHKENIANKLIKIVTKLKARINNSGRLITKAGRIKTTIRSSALSYMNAPNETFEGTPTRVKYRMRISSPTFPSVAVKAKPAKCAKNPYSQAT